MDSTDSSSEAILLDDIAEEFTRRQRNGESPTAEEFVQRYPQHAAAIRQFLETLNRIENARPHDTDTVSTSAIFGADGAQIKQLDDYRILREIGRGGMGVVFEAEQVSLGRRVALKVLPQASQLNPQQFTRFRLEARATARLEHPHIVPIHSIGEDDSLHYFTMQYIDGPGLGQVLDEVRLLREEQTGGTGSVATSIASAMRQRDLFQTQVAVEQNSEDSGGEVNRAADSGPETTEQQVGSTVNAAGSETLVSLSEVSRETRGSKYFQNVALIGVQISSALDFAHRNGILHRDVKPSNILLDLRGKAWITDFGLAKTEDAADVTNTGDIVGTLRYMAPERFDGWADRRSDVYSLGLTLYELATLKPAFGNGDRAELVQKIRDASTPPPRSIDPRIPADLETIILKAVAREPAQRYRTAGLLGEDLDRFLAGQPIQARRTSAIEKSRLWCRRNPVMAMLLLMLFAALTTGFATSSWYWRKATVRASAAKISEKKAVDMANVATRRAKEANEANKLAAQQRDVATKKATELRAAIDQLFSAIADDPLLKTVALEKFRRKMLERANAYYAQFHAETPDDPELAYEHAQLTFKLAEMNRELGDLRTAKRLFSNILQNVEDAETPHPALFPIAYKCRLWLADCSWKLGKEDDQLSYLIGEAQKFVETHSPATAAKFLTECAHMALNVHRVSDAWALSNQADELWTSIEPAPGMQRQHDLRVALHSTTRCQLALQVEEYELARAAARRAVELLKPYGPNQMVTATIADMDYLIGVSYSREGRYEEATQKYRQVINVFREMQEAHPDVLRYQTKLMDYHYHLGLDLHRQNKHNEALEILEVTLQKLDELRRQYPDLSIEHKRLRGDALNVISGVHARLGNYEDQGECTQLAIDAFEEIRGDDTSPLVLMSLGNAWAHRGNYLVNVMADRVEQIAAYDQAIEILVKVASMDPKSTQARQFLAEACFEQAMIHLAAGDRLLASQRFDQASKLDAGEHSDRARNEKERLLKGRANKGS